MADYPFTTLEPQLGVLKFKYHDPCIIADIPGIIEGAHHGAGLGLAFLKHIERTRVLLHVVDISDDSHLDHYAIIGDELKKYREDLAHRVRLIILNKIDLVDPEMVLEIRDSFYHRGLNTIAISALSGEGIEVLKNEIAKALDELEDTEDIERKVESSERKADY